MKGVIAIVGDDVCLSSCAPRYIITEGVIIHAVKLFLDNTGLHRAPLVLRSGADEPVFLGDAMALLHLAEHIMFSDELAFSTFETNAVTGMSQQIKEDLDTRGYTSTSAGSLISTRDFTELEFAGLCDTAIVPILEDLGRLQHTATLESALKLAGTASRPFGAGESYIEKWLSRSWNSTERLRIKERALERKSTAPLTTSLLLMIKSTIPFKT